MAMNKASTTLLSFLEDYVVNHFQEEEELMLKHQYAGYETHKRAHEQFRNHVKELRENFNNNKPLTHVIFHIRRIIDALTHHIRTIDIGISNIVRGKS